MKEWETHLQSGVKRSVGGIEEFYIDSGVGPTLLLIHGWASSSFTWRKVIGRLAADFHIIAVDLPGFGNSQPLPHALSLDAVGSHLIGLMDILSLKRFAVMGHSMGCVVASYLASTYPERVWGLVLAAPGFITTAHGRRPFYIELARRRPVGRLLSGLLVNRRFVGRALRSTCHMKEVVDDDMVEGYFRSIEKNPLTLLEVSKLSEGFSVEMLKGISARTMVVWGSHDKIVPVSVLHEVSKSKGWRVEVIDGTGHLLHEEKPEEFCRIVSEFLSQASQPSAV